MSAFIDFRELRAKLDVVSVLKFYGIEPKITGDQHLSLCPLPGHFSRRPGPCFSVNIRRGVWQCFGCKACGNILDLAVRMEKLNPESGRSLRDVAFKLKKHFIDTDGISANKPKRTSAQGLPKSGQQDFFPAAQIHVNAPLDFELKDLDTGHPYFSEQRFTKETVALFGLGFCSRGSFKDRVVIPLRDEKAQLVGYCGLELTRNAVAVQDALHRFPEDRERNGAKLEFKKSLFLYNGHRVTAPVSDLIVTDWFEPVWWLHQAGFTNVVSLMGSDCSEAQADLILEKTMLDGCVWFFPKHDTAGIRCATTLFHALGFHRKVKWVKGMSGDSAMRSEKEALARILAPSEEKAPEIIRSVKSLAARVLSKSITSRGAIVEVANSFPSLRPLNLRSESWDASVLDLAALKLSSGGRMACQFVLRVWSAHQEWKCGEFNVIEALDMWDSKHREAFLSWAHDPWWV